MAVAVWFAPGGLRPFYTPIPMLTMCNTGTETGIRIGIGSLVPEAFRDMPREEIESLLMSEIRLKNSMQDFIVEQNLYDDYVIWRGKQEEIGN